MKVDFKTEYEIKLDLITYLSMVEKCPVTAYTN